MNVIHISMDTLTRTYLGCYGNKRVKTLASKSVKFTKAYCASFPCMPARRDFLTGRYEFPFRGWGPLDEDDNELPLRLKDTGVVTGLITDHFHLWEAGSGNYHMNYDSVHFIRGNEADMYMTDSDVEIHWPCSPERLHEKIRKRYMLYREVMLKREEDWFAPRVFNTATDWIEKNKGHAAFYLYIDCFPPHEPFDPPPGYAEMYDPDYKGERLIQPDYVKSEEYASAREIKNIQALYAGNITHVDKWFGKFIRGLEKLGLMDNTMVILNTDHGTYTGEHGWLGKIGTHMYECVSHIPFIIYHPEIAPGQRNQLISNVDICPTILDALGRYKNPEDFHGESILPILKNPTAKIRDYAHFGYYGHTHGVTDGRYVLHLWHDNNKPLNWYSPAPSLFLKMIELGKYDGEKRPATILPRKEGFPENALALFDLQEDPREERNIFNENVGKREELLTEIGNFLKKIKAPAELFERMNLKTVK